MTFVPQCSGGGGSDRTLPEAERFRCSGLFLSGAMATSSGNAGDAIMSQADKLTQHMAQDATTSVKLFNLSKSMQCSPVMTSTLSQTVERVMENKDAATNTSWSRSVPSQNPPGGNKLYQCSECSFATNRAGVKHHHKMLFIESRFQCSECSKCFTQHVSLVRHLRIHTGERPYQCTRCSSTFIQANSLTRHLRTHTDAATSTSWSRVVPSQNPPGGNKRYQCSECSFATNRSGVKHHHKMLFIERPFQCSECSKCFAHHVSLVRHLRIHTGERPYQCTRCSRTFTQANTLTRHLRTHTDADSNASWSRSGCSENSPGGKRQFQCPECSYSTNHCAHLNHHYRVHTRAHPFRCSECSKCFAWKFDLMRHLRTHTGERPFQCTHCVKSFKQRGDLTVHLRIHTDERPYKCHLCPVLFRNVSNLNRHVRRHEQE